MDVPSVARPMSKSRPTGLETDGKRLVIGNRLLIERPTKTSG